MKSYSLSKIYICSLHVCWSFHILPLYKFMHLDKLGTPCTKVLKSVWMHVCMVLGDELAYHLGWINPLCAQCYWVWFQIHCNPDDNKALTQDECVQYTVKLQAFFYLVWTLLFLTLLKLLLLILIMCYLLCFASFIQGGTVV